MQVTLYSQIDNLYIDAYPITDVMIYLASISICFFETGSCYVGYIVLEHEILLPESLKYGE